MSRLVCMCSRVALFICAASAMLDFGDLKSATTLLNSPISRFVSLRCRLVQIGTIAFKE